MVIGVGCSGDTSMTLRGDDTYDLTVEPNGLLSENMLVRRFVAHRHAGRRICDRCELHNTTSEEWWMILNEPAKRLD